MSKLKVCSIFISLTAIILWAPNHVSCEIFTKTYAKEQLQITINSMLQKQDYVNIEKHLRNYQTNKSRFSDGTYKLNTAFVSVANPTNGKSKIEHHDLIQLQNHVKTLNAWKKAMPESIYPPLALAELYLAIGEANRDIGYSSSSIPWKIYPTHSKAAEKELIEFKHKHQQTKDHSPVYYPIVIKHHALNSHLNKKEEYENIMAIFNKGSDKYPNYFPIYITTSKWLFKGMDGQQAEREIFAIIQGFRNSHNQGKMLYTRISESYLTSPYNFNFFHRTKVNWDIMKGGFEQMISVYPTAWNLNKFAWLACISNDKVTAQRILEQIDKTTVFYNIWGGKDYYNAWRSWANTPDFPLAEHYKNKWSEINEKGLWIRGKIIDGSINGLGEINHTTGRYEGWFENNRLKGLGFHLSNGIEEYRGVIIDMDAHGPGIETAGKSENVYRGTFRNDTRHIGHNHHTNPRYDFWGMYNISLENGIGLRIANNHTYCGQFDWGSGFSKPSGFGMKKNNQHNQTYYGELKDDKPHGFGAIKKTNPKISSKSYLHLGYFENGKYKRALNKKEKANFNIIKDFYPYNSTASDVYIGYLKNKVPSGKGLLINDDYITFSIWKDGKNSKSKTGAFNQHDMTFEIYYKKERDGVKKIYKANIKNGIIYDGFWKRDEFIKGAIYLPDHRILRVGIDLSNINDMILRQPPQATSLP